MMKKNKNTKGITLIALIITIIILVILSGIVISSLTRSGLFSKAEETKEKTIKAQLKEEIELAVQEIQIEELQNGNSVTLETLAEKLLKNLNDITANLIENKIIGIYKGYEYEIDGSFYITIKDNNNITVTAEIVEGTEGVEEWYGTKVKVKLATYEGKNEKVAKIVYKINENQEIQVEGKETDIIIDSEGENTITYYAISTNGSKTEKKEKRIKIDKTKPSEATIIQEEVFGNSAIVNLNAIDELSGISKYDIYVNDTKNMETKETTANINNLLNNTSYKLYVKAIDKAGNISEKSEEIIIKTINVYIKKPITFEKMKVDSTSPPFEPTNVECAELLFDENLDNGSYGALLLRTWQEDYFIFSTEKNVKIDAYGEIYRDGGGVSDKKIKISKYNEETKQYEEYDIISSYSGQWYELATIEPGRYMIRAYSEDKTGYIRFDEWRLTEQ